MEKKGIGANVAYWDSAGLAMVRATADGNVVVAKMELGGSGFLLPRWPTGEITETLVPNPAAAVKKETAVGEGPVSEAAAPEKKKSKQGNKKRPAPIG